MGKEFTENEVKQALAELVENGELKMVYINGKHMYVEPDWQPPAPPKESE